MNKARQRGYMLLDLIIFILVTSIALGGILSVIRVAVKSSSDPMIRKQVLVLAESVLEEVLQKEYADTDPGGLPGNETTRATMDDVDDYQGKTEAIFTDWPVALSSYQVALAVTTADLDGASVVPIKKVTVTVTGSGHVISLSGYRADY
jgi:MSHA pilin protein MshD